MKRCASGCGSSAGATEPLSLAAMRCRIQSRSHPLRARVRASAIRQTLLGGLVGWLMR